MELLTRKYRAPVFQYLLCQGRTQFDAEDLLQDFFAFAMRTRLFEKADEHRGRFRSVLLRSLNHFAANDRRRQAAQRRSPEHGVGSLNALLEDEYFHPESLKNVETPEVQFHRAWVREVLRNVLRDLEEEFTNSGKISHFSLFETRVVRPELEGEPPPPLAEQAKELGLEYKEAANQILTAKRAFLRILERELRGYVRSEDEAGMEREEVLRLIKM